MRISGRVGKSSASPKHNSLSRQVPGKFATNNINEELLLFVVLLNLMFNLVLDVLVRDLMACTRSGQAHQSAYKFIGLPEGTLRKPYGILGFLPGWG